MRVEHPKFPELGNGRVIEEVVGEKYLVEFLVSDVQKRIVFPISELTVLSTNPREPRTIVPNERRVINGKRKIAALCPESISAAELAYLESVREDVSLRFSWPSCVDDAVLAQAKKLEIPMPDDARPINSGFYGGASMYSLSTEVSFPAPKDAAALPKGHWQFSDDGTRVKISRVTYSLGLRRAGFPITAYAHK